MTYCAKVLFLASIILTATSASAQREAPVTLTAGGPIVGAFGTPLADLKGQGALSFSDDLIGALAVAGIQTTAISPATGSIGDAGIAIGAPIARLSAKAVSDDRGGPPTIMGSRVETLGGALLTAPAANFATAGGYVSVTDIIVDLDTQGIYATLAGDHGLNARQVRVWDYADIQGATSFVAITGTHTLNNQLTGLTITTEAFDLFAQGLGLKAGGIAAMRSIADYGVMTSSLSIYTALPEPSSYLMMGLGLGGMFLAARRRKSGGVPA